MNINFVFMAGEYNGSTLCVLGRNQIGKSMNRELPVVGGTGVFRMARGVSISNTYSFDPKPKGHEHLHVVPNAMKMFMAFGDSGSSKAQRRGSVWQSLNVYKPQAPTHRSNVYGRPASPEVAARREFEKSSFTKLNTSRDEILTVLEERNLVPEARRITQVRPGSMNHYKYYRYHRARGHSTGDCFQLKLEIEKLIAQGKLKEYVRRGNPNNRFRSRSSRKFSEQHHNDQH
ncbi:hypothetical protein RD792_006046 [Penstemon davidsonii]|uniref:Dirigent protein n=1 Tax=Penstemon davidsonii TaxID=160366 RepID=A0ABR0DEI0_9LAMI|nr:hypothetical protein RD792_006046 [Penstemon davidsonii]